MVNGFVGCWIGYIVERIIDGKKGVVVDLEGNGFWVFGGKFYV